MTSVLPQHGGTALPQHGNGFPQLLASPPGRATECDEPDIRTRPLS